MKKVYMQGFNDCPLGVYNGSLLNFLERQAYQLGWNYYVIGKHDSLTEEDVLETILTGSEEKDLYR